MNRIKKNKISKGVANPPMKIENLAANKDINEDQANFALTRFIEQTKTRNAQLVATKEEVKKKKKYYEEEFENEAIKKTEEIKSFIGIPSARTVKNTLVKLNESYTESFKEQAKYTSDLFKYITDVLGVLNAVIFMEALAYSKINKNANSIKKRAERINTLSQSLEKGTCSMNELLDFVIDATAELEEKDEELNNEINEELSLLKSDLKDIKNTLNEKVDKSILTGYATTQQTNALINGLNAQINNKADKSELGKYVESGDVYTKDDVDQILKKYIKSEEVNTNDKINKLINTKINNTKVELKKIAKKYMVCQKNAINTKITEGDAKLSKRITRLWIAYGITTAVLVAGLIASFFI
jgi:gas vesicle protein